MMKRSAIAMVILLVAAGGAAAGFLDRSSEDARPTVHPDLPATSNDLRLARAQNSPMLAADPRDPRFVALAVRLDAPDFGCGLQVSGDGGRTFVPTNPVPKLPPRAEKCYAPEIAFDRDGNLYYLFLGLRGRGNNPMGVFLTKSSDRGVTFSKPIRLLGPGNYQVRMAIDTSMGANRRIHLVWLKTTGDAPTGGLPPPPNPIVTAYSDDGGRTLSEPVEITERDRPYSVAPSVALGSDHSVHVVYYDLEDDARDYQGLEGPTWAGAWSLVATSSFDGGETFEPVVTIDDDLVPPERVLLIYTMPPPTVAVSPDGRVHAAWHDARNGDWDVFVSTSTNEGRSWSSPKRINDDEIGNGKHQYLPRISTAPEGRVDVVFLDRRRDSNNVRNDTFYTFSSDGGQTFARNERLTSETSDSRSGQHYLVPSAGDRADFGSRIALISLREEAVAAWTDTRNALLAPYQDVYGAKITDLPSGMTTRSPWVLPAALVLLLAGGAIMTVVIHARSRRNKNAVELAAVLAALLVGCTGPESPSSRPRLEAPLPPPAAFVDVAMKEYTFGYREPIPDGRVIFHVRNTGREDHEFVLVALPKDAPRFAPTQDMPQIVSTVFHVTARAPGEARRFAVDLAPGRYGMLCFVREGDVSHADKGMRSEFTVKSTGDDASP